MTTVRRASRRELRAESEVHAIATPDVPRDVLALVIATGLFLALGVVLSLWIGAPIVIPLGKSPVMEVEAPVPFLVTLAVYLAIRFARWVASGRPRITEDSRSRLTIDLFLLANFAVVVYVHFHLKMWVPFVNELNFDATFFALDERCRTFIDGLRALRASIAEVLPAADLWYDLLFFSMFSTTFWFHTLGHRRWLFHNMVGITLVEMIGPLVYLAMPACGPFLFETGVNARATIAQQEMYARFSALREGGLPWMTIHGPGYFTASLAAMPSLHVAATVVLAYYAVRARLAIAPLVVLGTCWIAVEAVVSRWHYLVDLPTGLIVSMASIYLTNRICQFRVRPQITRRRHVTGTTPARGSAPSIRSSA